VSEIRVTCGVIQTTGGSHLGPRGARHGRAVGAASKRFGPVRSDETIFRRDETISGTARRRPETNIGHHRGKDQQRSSVMSTFLTLIYREFCRARLAEMRKQHLATVG
jgi:hypothetical protein